MFQDISTDLLGYIFLVVVGLCCIGGLIAGMFRNIDKPNQADKKGSKGRGGYDRIQHCYKCNTCDFGVAHTWIIEERL